MVKILFVDHTPFVGGAQLVLAEHIAALDKHEFEVSVACTETMPDMVDKFEQAGATVHIVPMPRLREAGWGAILGFWQSVRKIRQLVKSEQIAVVVTNTTRASYVATLAVLGTKTKLVWWVRDFLYPKTMFRLLSWRTNQVIFVSKAVRDWYGFAKNRKSAVFYVASNLFQSLETVTVAKVAQERARYGFGPDDIVVGFMGRLVEEKGAQDLVTAVTSLHPTYSKLKLLLVGTGQGQLHDIEPWLAATVKKNHLEGMVTLAGYQTNEALYYSLFDIFVLATRDHEPYATSVVQAMMAGKPVIGTEAGGTPELVINGQTGLLYQPGNVEGLMDALKKLLHDPLLAQRLAEAGKRHVLEFNREDQLTAQAEKLYRHLAAQ